MLALIKKPRDANVEARNKSPIDVEIEDHRSRVSARD